MLEGWVKYMFNQATANQSDNLLQNGYTNIKSQLDALTQTGKNKVYIGDKKRAHEFFNKVNNYTYFFIYLQLIRIQIKEDIQIEGTAKTKEEYDELFKTACIQKKLACSSQVMRTLLDLTEYSTAILLEDGGIDFMTLVDTELTDNDFLIS
ncbi:MAG: hypothetical protein HC836_46770 [Richelia sp. RM2_1_2]|nr:hypothetical protein [Richelia sp. RM2_1_2]